MTTANGKNLLLGSTKLFDRVDVAIDDDGLADEDVTDEVMREDELSLALDRTLVDNEASTGAEDAEDEAEVVTAERAGGGLVARARLVVVATAARVVVALAGVVVVSEVTEARALVVVSAIFGLFATVARRVVLSAVTAVVVRAARIVVVAEGGLIISVS